MHKLPNKLTCIVNFACRASPRVPASPIQIEKPHRAAYSPARQGSKYRFQRPLAVSLVRRLVSGLLDDGSFRRSLPVSAGCSHYGVILAMLQRCRPIWLALSGSPIRSHGLALEPTARSVSELSQNAKSERQIVDVCKELFASSLCAPVISAISGLRSIEAGLSVCC